jgi:hypothetical protein
MISWLLATSRKERKRTTTELDNDVNNWDGIERILSTHSRTSSIKIHFMGLQSFVEQIG